MATIFDDDMIYKHWTRKRGYNCLNYKFEKLLEENSRRVKNTKTTKRTATLEIMFIVRHVDTTLD